MVKTQNTVNTHADLDANYPESEWTNMELFQVCKEMEWGEAAKLTRIGQGNLKRVCGEIAQLLSKTQKFPQNKQVADYVTEELKVFCQVWKESSSTMEVGRRLGISGKKACAISKWLRSKGVKVPLLEGEVVRAGNGVKVQFDWMRFAKVIKMAPTMEFAAETLDMSCDEVLESCMELRTRGVNCPIPPYDKTPEWIEIRGGYELSQVVFKGNKHGGGRNYKIRHAGYRRSFSLSFGESRYLSACFS